MDSTIVGAIIGAVGALIASVLGAKLGNARKDLKKIEGAIASSGKGPDSLLSRTAAFTIAKVEKVVSLDAEGSGTATFRWHGIQPGQEFQNLKVPIKYSVEGPGSSLGSPTVRELDHSSLPVRFAQIPQMAVAENDDVMSLTAQVLVNGNFGPESDPVSFEMEIPFTKGHLMTREAVEQTFGDTDWNQEFTASSVIAPTRELYEEVRFPESFRDRKLRVQAVAFVGGTNVVHRSETKRIESGFDLVDDVASLRVDEPVLGLAYAISWMPPRAG